VAMMSTSGSKRATRKVPADRRVEEALRRDIFGGALPAATPLRETALAERFGVGRYTVRAALAQLAVDGLVEQTPNIGARVRRLTIADAEDIYQVRRTLELSAVQLVVDGNKPLERPRRAAARIAELETADLARPTLRRRALDADLAFHRSAIDAAGSKRLSKAYSTILSEVRLFQTQLIPTARVVPGEHWGLYEALADGDVAGARRWIDAHLRQGLRDVIRALKAQSP
jgi:DNA-binding GntR family transcriptional regulator